MARLAFKISGVKDSIRSDDEALQSVSVELATQRGGVKLKDLLEAEGRRQARSILDDQLAIKTAEILEIGHEIASKRTELKQLEDRKRRSLIEDFYYRNMSSNLDRLNVTTILKSTVTKIDSKIKDTGSDQPRAILAYVMAVYETIKQYTTSVIAPLVIDSPIQQDQDHENSIAMLELLTDARWSDDQMILGTVSMHDVHHGDANVVVLDTKYKVLHPDQYDAVQRIMLPLVLQM